MQSMAAAMAELTRQNQELIREINLKKQRYKTYTEGQAQNQEDRGNAELESESRGTTSRRVPNLEKEMDQMRKVMAEIRENMRRAHPVEDLVHRMDTPCLQSSRYLHWIRTMERLTHLIILQLSRLPCTFKESQMRLCVEPSLPLSKGQHDCGSAKYPRTQ